MFINYFHLNGDSNFRLLAVEGAKLLRSGAIRKVKLFPESFDRLTVMLLYQFGQVPISFVLTLTVLVLSLNVTMI